MILLMNMTAPSVAGQWLCSRRAMHLRLCSLSTMHLVGHKTAMSANMLCDLYQLQQRAIVKVVGTTGKHGQLSDRLGFVSDFADTMELYGYSGRRLRTLLTTLRHRCVLYLNSLRAIAMSDTATLRCVHQSLSDHMDML
jgi:hypothetical protein